MTTISAAEIANRTTHGIVHFGWVSDQTGGYRGQMAVLVKPNGLLGTAYMAAIMPFRHLIVYPLNLQTDVALLKHAAGRRATGSRARAAAVQPDQGSDSQRPVRCRLVPRVR